MSVSGHPEITKAAARKPLREVLKQVSPDQRTKDSAALCRLLTLQPQWIQARSVLLFMPLPGEPDIWPLAAAALASGKMVTLPRFVPEFGGYQACAFAGELTDLAPGQFGIGEPAAHCPTFSLKQLDLALVPGIGFTLDGGRLGRGKGYFDRLLADVPGFKCGVAFDCQIVPALPLEPHDVRLNCILTPTRWHPVICPPRS